MNGRLDKVAMTNKLMQLKRELHYKCAIGEKGKWEFIGAGKDSNEYKNFKNTKKRWEFIGSKPPDSVLKKYKNRLLIEDNKPLKAQQNGFRYLN